MTYFDYEDLYRMGHAEMPVNTLTHRTFRFDNKEHAFEWDDNAAHWIEIIEEGVHTMQPDKVTATMSEQEKEYNREAIIQAHSLLARMIKIGGSLDYSKTSDNYCIRMPMSGVQGGWRLSTDHVLVEAIMQAAIKAGMITKEQAYGVVEAKPAPVVVSATVDQCSKCGYLNGKHSDNCWAPKWEKGDTYSKV